MAPEAASPQAPCDPGLGRCLYGGRPGELEWRQSPNELRMGNTNVAVRLAEKVILVLAPENVTATARGDSRDIDCHLTIKTCGHGGFFRGPSRGDRARARAPYESDADSDHEQQCRRRRRSDACGCPVEALTGLRG